jgi:MFS family permease
MNPELLRYLKHNMIVNILDGAFFGLAIGFASFVTVLPLYVRTMTSSAILIGLVPAIHSVGWQLPQLFTARRVAKQKRFKPMVMWMTVLERLPFLGLAFIAWFVPQQERNLALALTFSMLIFQGLGAGVTANPWQSMIGKIIPSDRRGTFFGLQSAVADLLASLGAVLAGAILQNLNSPVDFTACFLLSFLALLFSWFFLSLTREPSHEIPLVESTFSVNDFWIHLRSILRQDRNFQRFLIARTVSFLAIMGYGFYTVYAVTQHGVSEMEAGWMTGVFMAAQIVANVVMGWAGDHWNHRTVMLVGLLSATSSGLLAFLAPSPVWFYLVFTLAAFGNAAIWTIGISMTLHFGSEVDRPAYIGLANTLVAPANILAPFLGGWLADVAGYPATFMASVMGGLAAMLIFYIFVHDPLRLSPA